MSGAVLLLDRAALLLARDFSPSIRTQSPLGLSFPVTLTSCLTPYDCGMRILHQLMWSISETESYNGFTRDERAIRNRQPGL